jgi:DNA polymerase-1
MSPFHRNPARRSVSPEYKTGRPTTPHEIADQTPVLMNLLHKMGFRTIEYPGHEADDVIGCLVDLVSPSENSHTYIFSSDKDFQQLLSDKCSILKPLNGGGLSETTPDTFTSMYPSLTPSNFIDLQALQGDSVDSVAGVRGIGPKTAHKLLSAHRTIDHLLEKARDEDVDKKTLGLSDKLRAVLLEDAETLLMGRELITLNRDLDLAEIGLVDTAGLERQEADVAAIHSIMDELETPSLARFFEDAGVL